MNLKTMLERTKMLHDPLRRRTMIGPDRMNRLRECYGQKRTALDERGQRDPQKDENDGPRD